MNGASAQTDAHSTRVNDCPCLASPLAFCRRPPALTAWLVPISSVSLLCFSLHLESPVAAHGWLRTACSDLLSLPALPFSSLGNLACHYGWMGSLACLNSYSPPVLWFPHWSSRLRRSPLLLMFSVVFLCFFSDINGRYRWMVSLACSNFGSLCCSAFLNGIADGWFRWLVRILVPSVALLFFSMVSPMDGCAGFSNFVSPRCFGFLFNHNITGR